MLRCLVPVLLLAAMLTGTSGCTRQDQAETAPRPPSIPSDPGEEMLHAATGSQLADSRVLRAGRFA